MGRDKVEFSQRYAYAKNNPALLVDPSGRCNLGDPDCDSALNVKPWGDAAADAEHWDPYQILLYGTKPPESDDPLAQWLLEPTITPACASASLGLGGVALAFVPYAGIPLSRAAFAGALAVDIYDSDVLGGGVGVATAIVGTGDYAADGVVKTVGRRAGYMGIVVSGVQCIGSMFD